MDGEVLDGRREPRFARHGAEQKEPARGTDIDASNVAHGKRPSRQRSLLVRATWAGLPDRAAFYNMGSLS
jgi:hypothetical protein